ncbi:MAG: hypothetical protein ABSB10_09435 [Candidatus Bathyarchaeia archaeon]
MSEFTPPVDTRINFESATAFVRKCTPNKKPIMLTGRDKGIRVALDAGWIIIDQQWFPTKR